MKYLSLVAIIVFALLQIEIANEENDSRVSVGCQIEKISSINDWEWIPQKQ